MVSGKQLVLSEILQILQLKDWWSNRAEETEENYDENIWDTWILLF